MMHYMLCCAIVRGVDIWGVFIFVRLILMLATH